MWLDTHAAGPGLASGIGSNWDESKPLGFRRAWRSAEQGSGMGPHVGKRLKGNGQAHLEVDGGVEEEEGKVKPTASLKGRDSMPVYLDLNNS